MNDFFAGVVVIFVFFLAGLGVVFVFSDVRHYKSIEYHCKERGYIQNNDTRIYCYVENNK
jgi:hypothetical protein